MNLETLTAELTRKFGEDAAQHALMRIVEKGWHLDPGENLVGRFAKVVARNYALDQRAERAVRRISDTPVDDHPTLAQPPTQEGRAAARQRLTRLLRVNPSLVAVGMAGSYEEAARMMGVAEGTVKSRVHRGRG